MCLNTLFFSYDLEFKDIHKQSHNGHETFRCRTCNISFANQSLLDMHMAAKQTPRVVSSLIQPKSFYTYFYTNSNSKLQIQTKAAKNNIRLPYACQYCSKEFARPYEKVKHERIHTGIYGSTIKVVNVYIKSIYVFLLILLDRRKTIRLRDLRQNVSRLVLPDAAHANAHRCTTVRVSALQ